MQTRLPRVAFVVAFVSLTSLLLLASHYFHASWPVAGVEREAGAAETPTAPASQPAGGKNWPLFRGDPLATGVAHGSLPEKLELLWEFEVDNGAFEGTAAIVDGVVYIGDLDGRVYALGLKDGKQKWAYTTDSGFIAAPSVRDGQLYIGDYDGRVHCLDIAKGELQWMFATEAEIDSAVNFYKGNVLVASQDGSLYCLESKPDGKEGKLVWKYATQDQIRCTPTVVEDRCFVAGCDSKLHIIDLTDGSAVASVEIDGPTGVTPAVMGDYVYFGTMGGSFYAVHWKEAEKAWTYEDERHPEIRSSPAVTPTHLVFGSRGKSVYALDPKDGAEKWRIATRNRVDSSPVIVGDRVYVGAGDGRLYGLRVKDGSTFWEYEVRGGFTGSPAVADGRMVIASDRGVVYCFGQK
ncbi:MAG: PQQ-binding-like beta-propeller repeat protein [Pirellulaceae bacterium]